jgi:hypothetical protein
MKLQENIAISDSGFIFNPSTGDSFSVNPIGHLVINLLNEGKTNNEILNHIQKEYMVDSSTFEKDLEDFINMLSGFRLITKNNSYE